MQFIVIARDGGDEKALDRRMAARAAHIACSEEAIPRGEQILGAAILSDNGEMRGSVMVVDFPSRRELDAWLQKEPYVTGKVWQQIEVLPCRVGPSFQHVLKKG
jgi:uncharacterized protein YciI